MADIAAQTPAQKLSREERRALKEAQKQKAKADRKAEWQKAKGEKKKLREEDEEKQDQLLAQLKQSLSTHARSATFACGGSLPIKADTTIKTDVATNGDKPGPAPVPNSDAFKALLAACQPASFGRGGEEVMDEDYRKAGKLDRSSFATTFCPYETGIIDIVTQLLLTQTKQSKHERSLRAELYKLNIYSAPSGKFMAHVDTPRSESQLGSLVVSLPVNHLGGELVVRNAGNEVTFDWSEFQDLNWAAFYSDCEHEVLEVEAGHRLTLTYNLYVTRGLGHLAGTASGLDATTLPLYKSLSTALENPGFLRRGRILAVWLTHSYAHTNKHVNFLPDSLKGADMSLYETASELGLRCDVVPMITHGGYGEDGPARLADVEFRHFNGGMNGSGNLSEYEGWGYDVPTGMVTWVNGHWTLGRSTKDAQKHRETRDKQMQEPQLAYMTYGNEPGIAIHYSRAAMLIRVPSYHERTYGLGANGKKDSTELQKLWAGIADSHDDYDEDHFEYDSYDDAYYDSDRYECYDQEDSENSDDWESEDEDGEDEGKGDAEVKEEDVPSTGANTGAGGADAKMQDAMWNT
ncbi:putative prolyl 4-hydroxylase alpha subunit, Fe(2+) 2OG dioxygenase domain-containing protein [Septoria linicola]|nr:putative prolyl 4-hydroxylase alpha subunit, Fe(2+) 2OG dioxygenase domain-containing protein [Septoria linicola]